MLSQSKLKIAGFVADEVPKEVTFVIARSLGSQMPQEMAYTGTTVVVPKQMSPRSAQHLFEWDLQTQRRDVVNLRAAEEQHGMLQQLKKEVDFELLTVLERPLLRMCLQAWKSQIKIRQKTVSLLW